MAGDPFPAASPPGQKDAEREAFQIRIAVPVALAAAFLLIDMLLHEVLGTAWRSITHYLMALLLLCSSFLVISFHQRTLSQRRAAREQLALREESYRGLFDEFPEPTTVWSGDGVLLLQNLVSARNLGGSRSTYLGKTIVEIFGPEAGRSYLERIQRVYRTGLSEQQEDAVDLATMGHRYFSTSIQRVRQPDGAPAVRVISYDITERVKAEHAWRAEHKRASMYLNIAAVMIVALDTDYRVTMINERGCEILGCGESQIVGRDWFAEFLPERVRDQVRRDYERLVSDQLQIVDAYHNPVLTLSGEERLIAWQTVVVRDETGRPLGTLSSGEDVTDRHRAEEALRASELMRAQERSALEERQRLARELHDSVSQALYGIALGVNTALATLDRDTNATRAALEYAIGLTRAGLSEMRALIFELRPESLVTEGLVAALTKQAEAIKARFEIPVDVDLCCEPDLTLPAKEALYRVSQEALNNTAKHAHARRVTVKLECDNRFVTLIVNDDGCGFDSAADYPGHLGLKSMRERVDSIGGTLRIRSGIGAGLGTTIEARVPKES